MTLILDNRKERKMNFGMQMHQTHGHTSILFSGLISFMHTMLPERGRRRRAWSRPG
jgi:hypothetical protein